MGGRQPLTQASSRCADEAEMLRREPRDQRAQLRLARSSRRCGLGASRPFAFSLDRTRSWFLRGHHRSSGLTGTVACPILLEISRLVERSNFNLARAWHWIGAAFYPGHRVVHVLDGPDPVTGDQLLGFGERTIDHHAVGTVEG